MTPLLAILIPTTPDRNQLLNERLLPLINAQRKPYPVEVIISLTEHSKRGGPTTGAKRNQLLDRAREINATHAAFIDSDDIISDRYFEAVMPGVIGDFDCCELWGQYFENGRMMNPFHHSIVHDRWWQDNKFYYRNPNHLNVIKLALLQDIKFKDITIGEDGNFSIDLQKAGVLKNQYPVNEIIYYYFAGAKRDHKHELTMARRRGVRL